LPQWKHFFVREHLQAERCSHILALTLQLLLGNEVTSLADEVDVSVSPMRFSMSSSPSVQ
jgi:hypothetical protein